MLCDSTSFQGIVFVYDVTNSSSFDNLEDWLAIIKKVFASSDKMPHLALVGNKSKKFSPVLITAASCPRPFILDMADPIFKVELPSNSTILW